MTGIFFQPPGTPPQAYNDPRQVLQQFLARTQQPRAQQLRIAQTAAILQQFRQQGQQGQQQQPIPVSTEEAIARQNALRQQQTIEQAAVAQDGGRPTLDSSGNLIAYRTSSEPSTSRRRPSGNLSERGIFTLDDVVSQTSLAEPDFVQSAREIPGLPQRPDLREIAERIHSGLEQGTVTQSQLDELTAIGDRLFGGVSNVGSFSSDEYQSTLQQISAIRANEARAAQVQYGAQLISDEYVEAQEQYFKDITERSAKIEDVLERTNLYSLDPREHAGTAMQEVVKLLQGDLPSDGSADNRADAAAFFALTVTGAPSANGVGNFDLNDVQEIVTNQTLEDDIQDIMADLLQDNPDTPVVALRYTALSRLVDDGVLPEEALTANVTADGYPLGWLTRPLNEADVPKQIVNGREVDLYEYHDDQLLDRKYTKDQADEIIADYRKFMGISDDNFNSLQALYGIESFGNLLTREEYSILIDALGGN